jgi:hypothetical protein
MDGIRINSQDSITCNDNRVESNVATDNQATKTQAYGLNINSALCNRTFVGTNNFAGNKTGAIRDQGTNTIYGTSDNQPPSIPGGLSATPINSGRVDLSWSQSSDNAGVTGYTIYRDGVVVGTTAGATATTFQDTTVAPSTTYSYTVDAFDAAGNHSQQSTAQSATTPVVAYDEANNPSGPSNALGVTTPAATSTLTFAPTADAYVRADTPTTTSGSATSIQVDNSPVKHFLIKFTVSGVGGRPVTSAKLRLFCVDPSDRGGDFHRVPDTTWSEQTVNWNNAPSFDAATLASLGGVTSGSWYEVDVSSLITGDGTYSLGTTSPSTNGADYSSKEGANPPQLVITLG